MSLTHKCTFSDSQIINATPLSIAASFGEMKIMRLLIESGASVDGTGGRPDTPLHFAAKEGHTQVIEMLIRSGADVNARDNFLRTPCIKAALKGSLSSIQALVKGGADITLQDSAGYTPLASAASQVFYAREEAWSGFFDVIVFLIHNMKDSEIFTATKFGFSLITNMDWAYPPFQSFLLNLAPNPSVYEQRQSNIITSTVATNNPINLKRLLRRLPKPLIPTLLAHRSQIGRTPLYAAATRPSEKLVEILLEAGADLELPGGDHGTPLMGACAAGRLEVVKTLMRKGAKTSYRENGNVFSALAAARLYPKVTRWLLVGRFVEGPLLIENGEVRPAY